jgi:hypothetical protein
MPGDRSTGLQPGVSCEPRGSAHDGSCRVTVLQVYSLASVASREALRTTAVPRARQEPSRLGRGHLTNRTGAIMPGDRSTGLQLASVASREAAHDGCGREC